MASSLNALFAANGIYNGYDPMTDMTNAQRMAAYMEMSQRSNQNFNSALAQQAYQQAYQSNPVNPEPNPVLLLLE